MTVEWGEFQNQGFCLGSKISLHFPSFGHSIIILEWRNEVEVSRMTLEWYLSIVIFISCHSRHFEMTKEWRNEEECRCFFRGRKNWIPRYLSSFVIPIHFKQELRLQSQMSVNDSEMTLENFNRMLSPLRRQHPIKSFRGHSTVIPLHFKQELRL